MALTGTDLYRDIHRSKRAQRVLRLATRIVALQPLAAAELEPGVRSKVRVVYQSVDPTPNPPRRPIDTFQVCVAGHLRSVKDPFRAAIAVRRLPAASRIRVLHAGAAMDESFARRAHAEESRNPRYDWLDEIPRSRLRRLIASSHVLVLSSRVEGGANVISEAIVDGTPVIASRIPGSVGLLGPAYPGYYPAGDTAALKQLLLRTESDTAFYRALRERCRALAPVFRPAREKSALRSLMRELQSTSMTRGASAARSE